MPSFTTRIAGSREIHTSRAIVAVGLAVAALAAIGAGVALPWVTVFRGLSPVAGFTLEGGPLAGIGLGAAGLLAIAGLVGGGTVLRPLAAAMATFVTLDAALVAGRIAAFVADPGPAGALTQPTAGIGAQVTAVGGLFLVLAAVAAPLIRRTVDRRRWAWIAAAVSLFTTGWIHLMLTPAHLGELAILGAGFLLAGLVQVLLAAVAAFRPSSPVAMAIVTVNATLVAVYAYAVLVGLPFAGGHEATGIVVGSGEPIDLAGAVSLIAEVASVALGIALLPGARAASLLPAEDRRFGWSSPTQ